MTCAPHALAAVAYAPQKSAMSSSIILILFFMLACMAQASPLPDDPIPPPPDPSIKSELVCRYVYISYPNAGETSLQADLFDEVPEELAAFMHDQTNGIHTFDMRSVKVPNDTLQTWMADYDTTVYISNYESMTYNQAEACHGPYGEVHAEILTEILGTYEQASRPNPFSNCDYIFFIHPDKLGEGAEGMANIALSPQYWKVSSDRQTASVHIDTPAMVKIRSKNC